MSSSGTTATRTLDRAIREWLTMHPDGQPSPSKLNRVQVGYVGLDGNAYYRDLYQPELSVTDDD